MTIRFASLLTALVLAIPFAQAQSPNPTVVVQAVSSTQAPAPQAATDAADASIAITTARALREIEAANDEILKKQAATLERLDELEKAAEQIKIYTKRG